MFEIKFSRQAEKFLDKCGFELRERILEKIKALQIVPVPHNSVSVVGEQRTIFTNVHKLSM